MPGHHGKRSSAIRQVGSKFNINAQRREAAEWVVSPHDAAYADHRSTTEGRTIASVEEARICLECDRQSSISLDHTLSRFATALAIHQQTCKAEPRLVIWEVESRWLWERGQA